MQEMRRKWSLLVAALLCGATLAVTAPGVSAQTSCAVTWGSLSKGGVPNPGAPIYNVRAGRHACFDRMVIDVRGPIGGYRVSYVPVVTGLATGDPIALRGTAFLSVTVGATDHYLNGTLSYPLAGKANLVNVTGYSTFRQVAWAESQEGLTQIGLGVRARLPFRVFVLAGPGTSSRLVVDVAHRW